MTLSDLVRFNIYVSMKLAAARRYFESVLVLLNVEIAFSHVWVSGYLAGAFMCGALAEVCMVLLLPVKLIPRVCGGEAAPSWAVSESTEGVYVLDDGATANPMRSAEGGAGTVEGEKTHDVETGVVFNGDIPLGAIGGKS